MGQHFTSNMECLVVYTKSEYIQQQKSARTHYPRDPGTIETCMLYVCPNEYIFTEFYFDGSLSYGDRWFVSLFCTHLSFLSPDNANEEDKKEFMDEIELMKKVGKHQNVLSFFGCWTTTKPILLMVEYIAHGDLLHWLRHKRAQVSKIITNW